MIYLEREKEIGAAAACMSALFSFCLLFNLQLILTSLNVSSRSLLSNRQKEIYLQTSADLPNVQVQSAAKKGSRLPQLRKRQNACQLLQLVRCN
jgi:hypothetical protein